MVGEHVRKQPQTNSVEFKGKHSKLHEVRFTQHWHVASMFLSSMGCGMNRRCGWQEPQ